MYTQRTEQVYDGSALLICVCSAAGMGLPRIGAMLACMHECMHRIKFLLEHLASHAVPFTTKNASWSRGWRPRTHSAYRVLSRVPRRTTWHVWTEERDRPLHRSIVVYVLLIQARSCVEIM